MYAHLFDHDNTYINKLEAIIDRFLEICDVKDPQVQIARDRLVGMVSLEMLIELSKKLPVVEQSLLKEVMGTPSVEAMNKFKAKFTPQDLLNSFNASATRVLNEKYNLIKSHLSSEKQFDIEKLLEMIGKY